MFSFPSTQDSWITDVFRRRTSCPWHSPACPGWECKHTGSLEEVHTWGSEHHSEVGAGGLWSSLGSQILGCNPNLFKKMKVGKGNEVKRRKREIQITLERRNPADEVVPSWNTYSNSQFYWDSGLTITSPALDAEQTFAAADPNFWAP